MRLARIAEKVAENRRPAGLRQNRAEAAASGL
jgi:hypothetical protein